MCAFQHSCLYFLPDSFRRNQSANGFAGDQADLRASLEYII